MFRLAALSESGQRSRWVALTRLLPSSPHACRNVAAPCLLYYVISLVAQCDLTVQRPRQRPVPRHSNVLTLCAHSVQRPGQLGLLAALSGREVGPGSLAVRSLSSKSWIAPVVPSLLLLLPFLFQEFALGIY